MILGNFRKILNFFYRINVFDCDTSFYPKEILESQK